MINTTKMKQDAEEGLRIADEATPGPWETDGGVIVETAEPIKDDPYRADPNDVYCADVCEVLHPGTDIFANTTAKFIADARTRAPEAYRNVIALVEALESEKALMSPEDEKLVREARERAKKASAGPWHVPGEPLFSGGVVHVRGAIDPDIKAPCYIASGVLYLTDAPFIAHARQDVPALCDLAERQAKEIERLSAELAQCKADAARLGALACDRQFTDG